MTIFKTIENKFREALNILSTILIKFIELPAIWISFCYEIITKPSTYSYTKPLLLLSKIIDLIRSCVDFFDWEINKVIAYSDKIFGLSITNFFTVSVNLLLYSIFFSVLLSFSLVQSMSFFVLLPLNLSFSTLIATIIIMLFNKITDMSKLNDRLDALISNNENVVEYSAWWKRLLSQSMQKKIESIAKIIIRYTISFLGEQTNEDATININTPDNSEINTSNNLYVTFLSREQALKLMHRFNEKACFIAYASSHFIGYLGVFFGSMTLNPLLPMIFMPLSFIPMLPFALGTVISSLFIEPLVVEDLTNELKRSESLDEPTTIPNTLHIEPNRHVINYAFEQERNRDPEPFISLAQDNNTHTNVNLHTRGLNIQ